MTTPQPQSQSPAPVTQPASLVPQTTPPPQADPVLCNHCGRTSSNGISCQGFCVADSDY